VPVVVLSNNDGCVIARSNEAKDFVPMGAPAFKFADIFKKNNIKVFSSNFTLYGDMSNRVMTIIAEIIPEIEIYSIDEAFLKLDGFENIDLQELGLKIRRKILKSTGIPISIGFAPTKALSKVANKIVKKFTQRTGGSYVIDSEEKRLKALKWLKVEDVWGIGRQHTKRLNNMGITTAFQFTNISDEWIKKNMSVLGLRLKKDLLGIPTLDLEDFKSKKSIATTRTFDNNTSDFEQVKERVVTFAVTCSEKLRRQKSMCNSLMVFVHTNYHRKDLEQYCKNIVVKLPYPTNSAIEISKFAVEGLKNIFKQGYYYKKAGVIIMDFTPDSEQQLSIFENSNPKHKLIMETLDRLNQKYGFQKIRLAAQDLKKTWKMHQEQLSPRYTTKIDEILKIKS
jgi:DNA polymerase V